MDRLNKHQSIAFDFAKWLIERDMDVSDMPADFSFNVHSANPVGSANIQGLLDSYLSFKENMDE